MTKITKCKSGKLRQFINIQQNSVNHIIIYFGFIKVK